MKRYPPLAMMLSMTFAIAFASLVASCASIQSDKLASAADGEFDAELASIETRLVSLDSAKLLEGDPAAWADSAKAARTEINALGKKDIRDDSFQARLAAYSGRLALLEDKPIEAARALKRASEFSGSECAVVILRARLEGDSEKRLAILAEAIELNPLEDALRIEQARSFLELKRYREAVASFDSALPRLSAVYSDTYRDERDRAWRLRDVSADAAGDTAAIAAKESILWRDVVAYASRETSLLDFFTGGKNVAADELFSRLLAKGIVRASGPDAPVTRAELSVFLWRLASELRADPSLLDKYSRRYATLKSSTPPIPDVPADSFFFDSAMGCVEWEIMSLPDGRLFLPDDGVSGAAYVQMLKKLR